MAKTVRIEIKDQDLLGALRSFLKTVLEREDITAVLVPWRLPMKNMVMPTLITDPQQLDEADPLSPAFAINTARVVSRLTRRASGGTVAAVMRPCEIRAFVELVKLKQGRTEDLVIIGVDCLGAYSNRDFFRWVGDDAAASTQRFYHAVLAGSGAAMDGVDLTAACKACESPTADGADIALGLYGVDTTQGLVAQARTAQGENLLAKLGLAETQEPAARQKTLEKLQAERAAFREAMFQQTRAATDTLEKLSTYLANCVNCYNCRVACPVCYCRECVFVTDVFDHEPAQYLRWAKRKGAVKLPTDTLFYHLTRMAHMSTACVGCGQCSNACPNDIPLMELFRSVAHRTQTEFGYTPGRSLDEKPPFSEFRENEFPEVVGMK
ncbi:MAG: 4Fe-4S dicluster domain-containing protein [Hyphomicrobiales bacterium]